MWKDLSRLWGTGTLTVLKYAETMRHPAQGQIELRPGTLANNVAAYYAESEQIATFLDINIHFNEEGTVTGAAGIIMQSLPGAELSLIDKLAEELTAIRPMGRHLSEGSTAVQLVRRCLSPWQPRLVSTRPTEFYCSCTKERFGRFLAALPQNEKGRYPRERSAAAPYDVS